VSGNPSILRVNGEALDVASVPLHESVLDFLRHRGLTGTKCGCNEGDCGACSVLMVEPDGTLRSVNSCLAFVHAFAGREIRTVEGMARRTRRIRCRRRWWLAMVRSAATARRASSRR
jgi:xanthine dehydrogenase iron-sulfur cluster and FAD-binding subunit A